jgi:hypothetical protein
LTTLKWSFAALECRELLRVNHTNSPELWRTVELLARNAPFPTCLYERFLFFTTCMYLAHTQKSPVDAEKYLECVGKSDDLMVTTEEITELAKKLDFPSLDKNDKQDETELQRLLMSFWWARKFATRKRRRLH